MKRGGLGRGLSDLFAEHDANLPSTYSSESVSNSDAGFTMVKTKDIHPRSGQPRKFFDENLLQELSDSIKQHGVLQPLLLVNSRIQGFEIIAGERRWRAAVGIGLDEVPAKIMTVGDESALVISIIENLQRAELRPIEEAISYKNLAALGLTHEDIARRVNKSRSHVTNMLRLCSLPEDVQNMLNEGKLSAGHAKALANSKDPSKTARYVLDRGLTVREVEAMVEQNPRKPRPKNESRQEKDLELSSEDNFDTESIAEMFGQALGVKAKIEGSCLKLDFVDLQGLDRLLQKLVV